MKTLIHTILLISLLLSGTLGAQEFTSLDDIKEYARENSLAYKKAAWDAVKAGNDVDGTLELEETSFSASANYPDTEDEFSSSVGAVIPLVDQLSLNGSWYDDNSRRVGLAFSPLSHSDDRDQQSIALQKALALAAETAVTAENSALSAALNWMAASEQLQIQEEAAAVQAVIYQDEKVRYEAGEVTLDDVRDALVSWTESRTALSAQQAQLRQKESALMTALNVNPSDVILNILDRMELEEALNLLKLSMIKEEADASGSYSVLSAYLEMKSVEENLADTWIFDPTLTLTASAIFGEADTSWEAGLQFGFSLQNLQRDEREELKMDLAISREEAFQADQAAVLALQQGLITLENTAQNREISELELEQALDLYEEALFLYERGEYSEAERDDAEISWRSAENGLFSTLVDEYLAWRDILLYLP